MKSRFAFVLTIAAGVALLAAPAAAQLKPEEIVKMRQGFMVMQKAQRGPLNAVAKGEAPLDDKAVQSAVNLSNLARMLPLTFPAGSGSDKLKGTRAKADIWAKPDAFQARVTALQAETAKLAELAQKKDLAGFKARLTEVANACNGCHDDFRDEE